MALSELNENTQNQILDLDLLDILQQIENLKNKNVRILFEKIARKYRGKVVNK